MNFLNLIKNNKILDSLGYSKAIFYFLFKKNPAQHFKININSNCLVLSQYPGAETKGLGGLIAQYPKNFEVLCLTNGSSLVEDFDPVESASIKKQQFTDVMKMARVKGYKIFNIDDNTLADSYSTFKKIDVSEADYIFIPNIYDINPDVRALAVNFKRLLKEKEYKDTLKIIFYESDYAICTIDLWSDIEHIIETKKRMLKNYYPEDRYPGLIDKIISINAFRSIQFNCAYCETFMEFSVEEFLKIHVV